MWSLDFVKQKFGTDYPSFIVIPVCKSINLQKILIFKEYVERSYFSGKTQTN